MDWKSELDDVSAKLADFRSNQSATARGFSALHGASLKEGALTTKEKELIAVAIAIAKQCSYCIGFHIKAAASAGATRAEIEEVIGVAIMMGGGPAMMYGAKTLEAWDQLVG